MLRITKLQLLSFGSSYVLMGSGINSIVYAQSQNHQSSDSLKSKQVYTCMKIDRATNKLTPDLLYIFMDSCIKESKYVDAVHFFALAGTYSFYDTQRVADTTSHQIHSLLLQQFLPGLDKKQSDRLFKELNKTLGNKNKLSSVCTKLKSIGAPDYYPEYMINHGLGAVTGKNEADSVPAVNGLIADFNPKNAWEKSLDGYLHCPK